MSYYGGPYITVGTIDEYYSVGATPIGPINLPYQRINDSMQNIIDKMVESYVPWEWWIEYNGDFTCKQRRGTDKSATISIVVSKNIGRITKEISSKQTSQRVRVVGRGESAEQDMATSDWYADETEMASIGSFYEGLDAEKTLSSKEESDIVAQTLLTQNAAVREEITVTLTNDDSTVSDYDIGDTVTIEDTDYGTSAAYRIKTIDKTVDENGETTKLTVTHVKTDISTRLASLQKQLDKLTNSSTFLDAFYGSGSNQTKISTDKIEDIWSQTASNKWAIDLPDDEADDPYISYCNYAGRGDIAYSCDKDVFEVYGSEINAMGSVFKYDPLLKYSRNPRFTCEFEIDTTGSDRDEWAENDQAWIRVWELDTMCGGGDPDNPSRYCCDPVGSTGFGFEIVKTATQLELHAYVWTDEGGTKSVKIANISYDMVYMIEARMEWKDKIVEFYFGKSDEDEDAEWGFRLRAVLPIKSTVDSDNLCPFHVLLSADSGTTKTAVVIYRWKTQAIRAVTKSGNIPSG